MYCLIHSSAHDFFRTVATVKSVIGPKVFITLLLVILSIFLEVELLVCKVTLFSIF